VIVGCGEAESGVVYIMLATNKRLTGDDHLVLEFWTMHDFDILLYQF
jgi:hypothetical protein